MGLVIGYQTETQNMHCFGNKKLGPLFTGRAGLTVVFRDQTKVDRIILSGGSRKPRGRQKLQGEAV